MAERPKYRPIVSKRARDAASEVLHNPYNSKSAMVERGQALASPRRGQRAASAMLRLKTAEKDAKSPAGAALTQPYRAGNDDA